MNASLLARAVLLPLLLISSGAHAQLSMPATTRVDVSELAQLAIKFPNAKELTLESQGRYPTALIGGRCMVGFLGKATGTIGVDALEEGSILVGAQKGNIVSFRVDAYQLSSLNAITGLSYVELAGKAKPELDKVIWSIRADSVHQGINLPQAYTGRDVLIGITDWGFDYTHPMFYDTALTSTRIRAAWDQYKQAGPPPVEYPYGTVMNTPAELLAAQADTINIYGYATHGSHVAGIAGGSGAGTNYRGVAFEAQYLFCTFLVDAAAVLDAFTWMQSVAEQDDKRLVINMSWGLHWIGTLDGNSLISQFIDQLSSEGVVFVNSAGNNGDVPFHIKKEFASDTIQSRVQFYNYNFNANMWGQSISVWGEPGEEFSAGFNVTNSSGVIFHQSPWFHSATEPAYQDSFMVLGNDTIFYNLTTEAAHPLNQRPHFRLRIKNRNTQYWILLKATATSGTVHFWNVTELITDVGNWGQSFIASQPTWTTGDRNYGISEPACTESIVTVAAHASDYLSPNGNPLGGTIASFSSYGPTLDERRKPDITAPGVDVASSISSFTDNNFSTLTSVSFQGRTYPFARFSGTSMSAPAVTGVVALMLEADPTLTPADVREIIKLTARTDGHTGVIPPDGSLRWGRGKVNAYHAVLEVLGITGIREGQLGPFRIWPNPVSDVLQLSVPDATSRVRITVQDLSGRLVYTGTKVGSEVVHLDASNWMPGLYLVHLDQDGRSGAVKVVKD